MRYLHESNLLVLQRHAPQLVVYAIDFAQSVIEITPHLFSIRLNLASEFSKSLELFFHPVTSRLEILDAVAQAFSLCSELLEITLILGVLRPVLLVLLLHLLVLLSKLCNLLVQMYGAIGDVGSTCRGSYGEYGNKHDGPVLPPVSAIIHQLPQRGGQFVLREEACSQESNRCHDDHWYVVGVEKEEDQVLLGKSSRESALPLLLGLVLILLSDLNILLGQQLLLQIRRVTAGSHVAHPGSSPGSPGATLT
mmetsp:Transcript_40764/g.89096  ORF Transcript_40764/g.89096 Transcript_40764/m.89096 type:complete len:251 (+) Transcript_40764:599-1351(+)